VREHVPVKDGVYIHVYTLYANKMYFTKNIIMGKRARLL
jgi:hypothetical protein